MEPSPVIDFSDPNEILLTQQKSLRKLVGTLGMLLPILLYVFLWVDTHHGKPLESLSHYYFTRVSGIFVITVSLLAIFLIIYKGKEKIDFILSALAGSFALLLVLFPTGNIKKTPESIQYAVTTLRENEFRVGLHYASAAIFLLSLAAMSLFLFTRSNKPKALRTNEKKIRNIIYRVCGLIMIAAILIVFASSRGWISEDFFFHQPLTFWMEAIAVESFGFAWLVKAEVILKDKK